MSRFMVCTIPVVGHISPAIPIARKLVERGHEVWWYTGSAFQSVVEATGARFTPILSGLDYSIPQNVPQAWLEQRNALQGPAQLKFDLKHFFIDTALGQVKDLAKILRQFPAEVVLADSFFLGASWLYEQGGPPWAELGISVLPSSSCDTAPFGLGLSPNASPIGRLRNRILNWIFQKVWSEDITTYIDKVRASIGLPACHQSFFDMISPFLYMAATIPEFEYPRSDLPSNIHFIGPLLSTPSEFTTPTWWQDLQIDKPIILVTQGTVATELDDLVLPTLRALEDEDLLVIATTGGKSPDSIGLTQIPANARIERFIPFTHLLPHIDVMVTNGGFNGVQMALANGVPLVAAGRTEDKPEVCARIEWAGVGINLKTKKPTPNQIKKAVKKVLLDPSYKTKANEFRSEISRYDAPTMAASLLEQLARTQQPITN